MVFWGESEGQNQALHGMHVTLRGDTAVRVMDMVATLPLAMHQRRRKWSLKAGSMVPGGMR